MWREMIIFADKQTHNQVINSKTEAHSNPLWIVGERANKREPIFTGPLHLHLYLYTYTLYTYIHLHLYTYISTHL